MNDYLYKKSWQLIVEGEPISIPQPMHTLWLVVMVLSCLVLSRLFVYLLQMILQYGTLWFGQR